jgi:hypothetical protein
VKHMRMSFALTGLLAASAANAWITQSGATIARLIQFEAGLSRDYTLVEFSTGDRCRILHTEKELLALTIALYMADRPVSYACYDSTEDPGSSAFPSHKLHRIIAD